MNHRILFVITTLMTVCWVNAQNTGNLLGTIKNEQLKPIENANIQIQDLQVGTKSLEDGKFQINNIPAGNYLLNISFVGLKQREIAFSINEGRSTVLPEIILVEEKQSLKEILITGTDRQNSFERDRSVYVSKLPLEKIENPQVYDNITAELLEQQVVTNFDDALKNSSGITKLWESTGRGGDGAGYYALRGFAVQPKLRNGLPGITNASPDQGNIENIEVIKGPSGTLFGSSLISYGGLINVITKKPYEFFGGSINYTGGSFGLN